MLTNETQLNWENYLERKEKLTIEGVYNNKIKLYDQELINNLRNYYYANMPLSILLLCRELCNKNCYESSFLLTFGFNEDEDYNVVVAQIDDVLLNPEYIEELSEINPNYSYHCFVEKKDETGITWVYDPSVGLMYEKELYYQMQNPKIISISNKEKIKNYPDYQKIKESNLDNKDQIITEFLPILRIMIKLNKSVYKKRLKEELYLYREKLGLKPRTKKLVKEENTNI